MLIEESASRTFARMFTKPNVILDEYSKWTGIGDKWSPWGSIWQFQRSLMNSNTEEIFRQTEQKVQLRPDHLQTLGNLKIFTSTNRKSALLLHKRRHLIPKSEIHVWTDGSKKNDTTDGFGGWCWSKSPHHRLTHRGHRRFTRVTSSFQAECIAMWQALRSFLTCVSAAGRTIVVLTDSRSLTTHLEGLRNKARPVSETIYAILEQFSQLYKAGAKSISIM